MENKMSLKNGSYFWRFNYIRVTVVTIDFDLNVNTFWPNEWIGLGKQCTSVAEMLLFYYVESLSNIQLLSRYLNQDIAFLRNFEAIRVISHALILCFFFCFLQKMGITRLQKWLRTWPFFVFRLTRKHKYSQKFLCVFAFVSHEI